MTIDNNIHRQLFVCQHCISYLEFCQVSAEVKFHSKVSMIHKSTKYWDKTIKSVLPCLNRHVLLPQTGGLQLSSNLCFMISWVSLLVKGQTTATAGPHPGLGISPALFVLWLRLLQLWLLKPSGQWLTHSRQCISSHRAHLRPAALNVFIHCRLSG